MNPGEIDRQKALEIEVHRALMNTCRKYINHVGCMTLVGVLDYVKQEVIELDRATKKVMERNKEKKMESPNEDFY